MIPVFLIIIEKKKIASVCRWETENELTCQWLGQVELRWGRLERLPQIPSDQQGQSFLPLDAIDIPNWLVLIGLRG